MANGDGSVDNATGDGIVDSSGDNFVATGTKDPCDCCGAIDCGCAHQGTDTCGSCAANTPEVFDISFSNVVCISANTCVPIINSPGTACTNCGCTPATVSFTTSGVVVCDACVTDTNESYKLVGTTAINRTGTLTQDGADPCKYILDVTSDYVLKKAGKTTLDTMRFRMTRTSTSQWRYQVWLEDASATTLVHLFDGTDDTGTGLTRCLDASSATNTLSCDLDAATATAGQNGTISTGTILSGGAACGNCGLASTPLSIEVTSSAIAVCKDQCDGDRWKLLGSTTPNRTITLSQSGGDPCIFEATVSADYILYDHDTPSTTWTVDTLRYELVLGAFKKSWRVFGIDTTLAERVYFVIDDNADCDFTPSFFTDLHDCVNFRSMRHNHECCADESVDKGVFGTWDGITTNAQTTFEGDNDGSLKITSTDFNAHTVRNDPVSTPCEWELDGDQGVGVIKINEYTSPDCSGAVATAHELDLTITVTHSGSGVQVDGFIEGTQFFDGLVAESDCCTNMQATNTIACPSPTCAKNTTVAAMVESLFGGGTAVLGACVPCSECEHCTPCVGLEQSIVCGGRDDCCTPRDTVDIIATVSGLNQSGGITGIESNCDTPGCNTSKKFEYQLADDPNGVIRLTRQGACLWRKIVGPAGGVDYNQLSFRYSLTGDDTTVCTTNGFADGYYLTYDLFRTSAGWEWQIVVRYPQGFPGPNNNIFIWLAGSKVAGSGSCDCLDLESYDTIKVAHTGCKTVPNITHPALECYGILWDDNQEGGSPCCPNTGCGCLTVGDIINSDGSTTFSLDC